MAVRQDELSNMTGNEAVASSLDENKELANRPQTSYVRISVT